MPFLPTAKRCAQLYVSAKTVSAPASPRSKKSSCGRANSSSLHPARQDLLQRLRESSGPADRRPPSRGSRDRQRSDAGREAPNGGRDALPAHRGEDPNTARRLALRSERVRSSLFGLGGHSERSFVTWHSSRVAARLAVSMGRRNRRGRAALGRRVAMFAPARRGWSCRLARPAAPACVRADGGRCVVCWWFVRDGCVRRGRGYAGARRLPRRW